jgi:hypothetical protein
MKRIILSLVVGAILGTAALFSGFSGTAQASTHCTFWSVGGGWDGGYGINTNWFISCSPSSTLGSGFMNLYRSTDQVHWGQVGTSKSICASTPCTLSGNHPNNSTWFCWDGGFIGRAYYYVTLNWTEAQAGAGGGGASSSVFVACG